MGRDRHARADGLRGLRDDGERRRLLRAAERPLHHRDRVRRRERERHDRRRSRPRRRRRRRHRGRDRSGRRDRRHLPRYERQRHLGRGRHRSLGGLDDHGRGRRVLVHLHLLRHLLRHRDRPRRVHLRARDRGERLDGGQPLRALADRRVVLGRDERPRQGLPHGRGGLGPHVPRRDLVLALGHRLPRRERRWARGRGRRLPGHHGLPRRGRRRDARRRGDVHLDGRRRHLLLHRPHGRCLDHRLRRADGLERDDDPARHADDRAGRDAGLAPVDGLRRAAGRSLDLREGLARREPRRVDRRRGGPRGRHGVPGRERQRRARRRRDLDDERRGRRVHLLRSDLGHLRGRRAAADVVRLDRRRRGLRRGRARLLHEGVERPRDRRAPQRLGERAGVPRCAQRRLDRRHRLRRHGRRRRRGRADRGRDLGRHPVPRHGRRRRPRRRRDEHDLARERVVRLHRAPERHLRGPLGRDLGTDRDRHRTDRRHAHLERLLVRRLERDRQGRLPAVVAARDLRVGPRRPRRERVGHRGGRRPRRSGGPAVPRPRPLGHGVRGRRAPLLGHDGGGRRLLLREGAERRVRDPGGRGPGGVHLAFGQRHRPDARRRRRRRDGPDLLRHPGVHDRRLGVERPERHGHAPGPDGARPFRLDGLPRHRRRWRARCGRALHDDLGDRGVRIHGAGRGVLPRVLRRPERVDERRRPTDRAHARLGLGAALGPGPLRAPVQPRHLRRGDRRLRRERHGERRRGGHDDRHPDGDPLPRRERQRFLRRRRGDARRDRRRDVLLHRPRPRHLLRRRDEPVRVRLDVRDRRHRRRRPDVGPHQGRPRRRGLHRQRLPRCPVHVLDRGDGLERP